MPQPRFIARAPTGSSSPAREPSVLAAILPIVATVFATFLATGLAMPALPLHVHHDLGLGAVVVGLVAGAQFAAALLSRFWSGSYSDQRGAKRAVVVGLVIGATAGLPYAVSLQLLDSPSTSAAVLLLGRAVFGASESFVVTGSLAWGLALVGPKHAGKVMSWIGTAIYVAFAVGAPAGTALYTRYGFAAIAVATTLVSLAALPLVARVRGVAPMSRARSPFAKVVRAVWLPGVGLALSSVGFGAITTFIVLLFEQKGWGAAWLAFTLMSVTFVIGRLFFGHLPDRIGGPKIALVSVLIEAAGQVLIWLSPWPAVAFLGAALTGLGYSLVYPGFGLDAVRRAPPEAKGLAMGTFTAFLDLALGLAGPALGLVATAAGVDAVFAASTLVVVSAAGIALRLMTAGPPGGRPRAETSLRR